MLAKGNIEAKRSSQLPTRDPQKQHNRWRCVGIPHDTHMVTRTPDMWQPPPRDCALRPKIKAKKNKQFGTSSLLSYPIVWCRVRGPRYMTLKPPAWGTRVCMYKTCVGQLQNPRYATLKIGTKAKRVTVVLGRYAWYDGKQKVAMLRQLFYKMPR